MKFKKVLISTCALLLGVIILSLFFAYFTNFNDPVTDFFKKIYPSALVDYRPISIYSLREKVQLSKNIDDSASFELITKQIINNLKLTRIAEKLNIFPDETFLNEELTFYTKNQELNYQQLIKNSFNNNTELFRENILIPLAAEVGLRIKYNTVIQSTSQEYTKAQNLLSEIQQGREFDSIAKEFSGDLESGQLGGDLGFFTRGEIFPELEKQIINAKPGVILNEIIVSRLGYHIIYPIESAFKDGNKYWHVKHVLIETKDFDSWLKPQLDKISVWWIK